MPISDKWTQAQIVSVVRRELMDPTGTANWSWSDTELNLYVSDWQDMLQFRFEFVWGTATVTTSTNTLALTAISTSMSRPGNIWWNNVRLRGRDTADLDILIRDWRAVAPGIPEVSYQDSADVISFWPAPAVAGTAIFEYPKILSFGTSTDTMQIPAWLKYTAINYCAYRAYMRPGPQQNLAKASRYKMKFVKQGQRISTIWEQHMPEKEVTLRPGGFSEGDTLNAGMHNTLFTTWF